MNCSRHLLAHVQTLGHEYKPVASLEQDLVDRHNVILLLALSLDEESRPFADLERIGADEEEVKVLKEFRFVVKGRYLIAVQGEPIQLLAFISRLGFSDQSISYRILHSQISSTMDVNVTVRPRVLYFDPEDSKALADEIGKIKENPERGLLALPKNWTEAITLLSSETMRPLFSNVELATKYGFKVIKGKDSWLDTLRELKDTFNTQTPTVLAHSDLFILNGAASDKLIDILPLTLPVKVAGDTPLDPDLLREMKVCFRSELCRTTGVMVEAAPVVKATPIVEAAGPLTRAVPEPATTPPTLPPPAVPLPTPIEGPVALAQPVEEAARPAPAAVFELSSSTLLAPALLLDAEKIVDWARKNQQKYVGSPSNAVRLHLAEIYEQILKLNLERQQNETLAQEADTDSELARLATEDAKKIEQKIAELIIEEQKILAAYSDPKITSIRIAIRRPQNLKYAASVEDRVFTDIKKMYLELARVKKWKTHEIEDQGFNVIELSGAGVDYLLMTESGVHRVFGWFGAASKTFQTHVDVRAYPSNEATPRVDSGNTAVYVRTYNRSGTSTLYLSPADFKDIMDLARQERTTQTRKKLAEGSTR